MQTRISIPPWMTKEVDEYDLDLAPAPATILDIGANIGAFTRRYAAKWPAAQISDFEPVAANFAALQQNTADIAGVVLNQVAVRAFDGRSDIFIGDAGVTCGFHQRGRQTAKTESVFCLDARKLISAELVKIDTEGCEVEILAAMDLKNTRALVVEYHQPDDIARLITIATDRGLGLIAHIPGSEQHGVLKFARPGAGVTLPGSANHKLQTENSKPSPVATRKHFVAMAVNREITVPTALALLKIAATRFSGTVRFCNGDGVARSRNRLTADFLASDCTHLLFIDSDIVFSQEDFNRIISHDVGVVGGLYPLRGTENLEWCANGLIPPPAPTATGLQGVRYIGTGFMCIAREVFERIILKHGHEIEYKSDLGGHHGAGRTEWDFWPMGVYTYPDKARRYLSEDWYFCQRWLDMGGEVFADPHVLLQHIGQALWPLPHQQKEFLQDQRDAGSHDRDGGRPQGPQKTLN